MVKKIFTSALIALSCLFCVSKIEANLRNVQLGNINETSQSMDEFYDQIQRLITQQDILSVYECMHDNPNWNQLTEGNLRALSYYLIKENLYFNFPDERNEKAIEVFMNLRLYHPKATPHIDIYISDLSAAMNHGNLEWFYTMQKLHPLWNELSVKNLVEVLNTRSFAWIPGVTEELLATKNENKKTIFSTLLDHLLEYPLTNAKTLFPLFRGFSSIIPLFESDNHIYIDKLDYEKYLLAFQATSAWSKLSPKQLKDIYINRVTETSLQKAVFSHPKWNSLSTSELTSILASVINNIDQHDQFDAIYPNLISIPSWNKLSIDQLSQLASCITMFTRFPELHFQILCSNKNWKKIPPKRLSLIYHVMGTSNKTIEILFSKHPSWKQISAKELLERILWVVNKVSPYGDLYYTQFQFLSSHPKWKTFSFEDLQQIVNNISPEREHSKDFLKTVKDHPNWLNK